MESFIDLTFLANTNNLTHISWYGVPKQKFSMQELISNCKKSVGDDGMDKDQLGVFLYEPVNPAKGH